MAAGPIARVFADNGFGKFQLRQVPRLFDG